MMDHVLDAMLTRIKELKVTNIFAAKYLCQRLLDASDTAIVQVNTLYQLNLVYYNTYVLIMEWAYMSNMDRYWMSALYFSEHNG